MGDYDEGMRVRREALGDAHVDRAEATTTECTAGLHHPRGVGRAVEATRARPGHPQRGHPGRPVRVGPRARAGAARPRRPPQRVLRRYIREVLPHVSAYARVVPAANRALNIVQHILDAFEESS